MLSDSPPPTSSSARLLELARIFLTFGLTAFGGPAAHIAMYHEELVRKRKWLDEQRFLDLLGATNLIPGPNSTEMCIHIGYLRAGWPGLIVAGVSFILPAVILVGGLAWASVSFGALPQAAWLLAGVTPVVVAILVQALYGLARNTMTGWVAGLTGAACAILYLLGFNPLLLLLATGLGIMLWNNLGLIRQGAGLGILAPLLSGLNAAGRQSPQGDLASPLLRFLTAGSSLLPEPFSLWRLFLVFLKIGSVLYGSGYVLAAFIQSDLVERLGWITQKQLLDAIAIGQITPGPVFTTATFIGYILGGWPGAIAATVGIFLPSFVFVALSNPLIPKIRRSPWAAGLLNGVNYASLGLMAGVTLELGWANLRDPLAILTALAAFILLVRYRVNTTWLILAGAIIGFVRFLLL